MTDRPESLKELGEYGVLKYWPKLLPSSYFKSSNENKRYNCVAWVNGIQSDRIDFSEDEDGEPILDPYYLSSYPYIEKFEEWGFELCGDDSTLEEGIQKIAIFEKDEQFKHVAIQLENGSWASKMGEYEDIVHHDLNSVQGHDYKTLSFGKVAFCMKRKRPENTPVSASSLLPIE